MGWGVPDRKALQVCTANDQNNVKQLFLPASKYQLSLQKQLVKQAPQANSPKSLIQKAELKPQRVAFFFFFSTQESNEQVMGE